MALSRYGKAYLKGRIYESNPDHTTGRTSFSASVDQSWIGCIFETEKAAKIGIKNPDAAEEILGNVKLKDRLSGKTISEKELTDFIKYKQGGS